MHTWHWIAIAILAPLMLAIALATLSLRFKISPPVDHAARGLRGLLGRGWRFARPAVVLVVGLLIVTLGLLMVPLPGPGWPVAFGGLALLATEFAWARWILRRSMDTATSLGELVGLGLRPPPKAGRLRLAIYHRNLRLRDWLHRRPNSRLARLALRMLPGSRRPSDAAPPRAPDAR